MAYEEKNFENLLGTKGFSDNLLTTHFGLYAGYVKNTNKLVELLKTAEPGTPQHAEMLRRFGWEFNGMRLHELYFGNMSKDDSPLDGESAFAKKLAAEFGSQDEWAANFKAAGALRGIGWTVLAYDKQGDRLFNVWINEHDVGHLAGAVPLLVMDVFEHAFVLDYGMKRGEYIAAFMDAIDWKAVAERFDSA